MKKWFAQVWTATVFQFLLLFTPVICLLWQVNVCSYKMLLSRLQVPFYPDFRINFDLKSSDCLRCLRMWKFKPKSDSSQSQQLHDGQHFGKNHLYKTLSVLCCFYLLHSNIPSTLLGSCNFMCCFSITCFVYLREEVVSVLFS